MVQPLFVVELELVRQLHLLPQHGALAVVDRVALELGKILLSGVGRVALEECNQVKQMSDNLCKVETS